MKKTLKITLIVLIALLVKFIFTFTVNEIIILNYNKDIYNTSLIKILYPLNFSQSYIVFYNDGNLLYKKGQYSEAIEKYNNSIDRRPPKNRICDVRINLSLAMIKTIDNSSKNNDVYEQLEKSKKNLYLDNCAHESDNNGSSQDAENLEEEIKNMQDQLNNSSNGEEQGDTKQGEEPNETGDDYSDIEEELKEIEKQANANRQSDMETYENIYNSSYYSGKKW